MKKLLAGVLCALTLMTFATACDDDKKEEFPDFERRFAEIAVEVTPSVLETIGGKVPATITLTIPPRFMWPEAEVTVTPVLRWAGGEAMALPFGFQGEKTPQMGGKVIPYETGGPVVGKTRFDYVPEMMKSELMLEFAVSYRQRTATFSIKAADGVIATI